MQGNGNHECVVVSDRFGQIRTATGFDMSSRGGSTSVVVIELAEVDWLCSQSGLLVETHDAFRCNLQFPVRRQNEHRLQRDGNDWTLD
jgi:hypothetical protein